MVLWYTNVYSSAYRKHFIATLVLVLKSCTTYPGEIHVRPNALDLESDAKSIFRNAWSRLLAAVKWLEDDARGAPRHSDKEKFRNDLNRPKGCRISEQLLKTLRKFSDFQAEYEGSLYFTRSNVFRALARAPDFVPTNPMLHFKEREPLRARIFLTSLAKVRSIIDYTVPPWVDQGTRQATFAEPIEWSVSGFR